MLEYDEIEVDILNKDGKTVKYSFPKNVIQYYRQFIGDTIGNKGGIKTMLYLTGSPKGLILDCGYDTFKKKLKSNTINVNGLNEAQLNTVNELVLSFLKDNQTKAQ